MRQTKVLVEKGKLKSSWNISHFLRCSILTKCNGFASLSCNFEGEKGSIIVFSLYFVFKIEVMFLLSSPPPSLLRQLVSMHFKNFHLGFGCP